MNVEYKMILWLENSYITINFFEQEKANDFQLIKKAIKELEKDGVIINKKFIKDVSFRSLNKIDTVNLLTTN